MPTFDIQTPGGKILSIEAPDEHQALAGARQWHDENGAEPPKAPRTGGGGMSAGWQAVGDGVASLAGMPADLMNAARGVGSSIVNRVVGTNLKPPAEPVGGSAYSSRQLKEGMGEGIDQQLARKRDESYLASLVPESPFRFAGNLIAAAGGAPVDYEALPTANKAVFNGAKVGTIFGLGGIGGALRSAPAVSAGPSAGSLAADLVAPARDMAAKTIAGDVGATLGTAAAQTAVDVNKDALAHGGIAGQLIAGLAPVAGGVAGAGLSLPATAAVSAAHQRVRPDPTLPVDPNTWRPYPSRVVDRAAGQVQGAALDPRQAATDLQENVQGLRDLGVERLPTAGVMSDDPGLVGVENRFRNSPDNRGSARMIDADRHVDTEAANRLATIGEGGDARAPGNFVQQRADAMRAEPRQAMASAEQEAAAVEAQRLADAAQLGQYADGRVRSGAALRLDHQVVEQGLRPAVAQKNEMFAAIDPTGTIMRPTAPLAERVAAIRRGAQDLPPELRSEVLPERFLAAIDNVAPRVEERAVTSPVVGPDGSPITQTEQVNTGGPGQISMRTVTEMVPLLGSAEAPARKAGQYGMADNIRALRQELGREPERLAAEGNTSAATAVDNYREQFAPTWAAGPGDEATLFRKKFNQDPTGRSTTAPSETAERFLSSPEKAQALGRIINSTPDPAAGFGAAREYVMSDLAVSGVLDQSGKLNLHRLRRWVSTHGEVAAAIPGLRDELEGITRQAADRQGQAQRLATDLKAAKARMKLTDDEIQQGVMGRMLGKDPGTLVESLLSSGDPQMSLREAVGLLKGDPAAMSGFASSIREYLGGKVTNSNVQKTLDDSRPVSPAKLENLMAGFGDTLAEALPPGAMQKLRATQAQLRPRQNLGVKAVVGSDTNANQQNQLVGMVDMALRAVPGGGLTKTAVRSVLQTAGVSADPRIGQLILGALERPETMGSLLTRDTRKSPKANWGANAKVGGVLGMQNGDR